MKNVPPNLRQMLLLFVVFTATSLIAYSMASTHFKQKHHAHVQQATPHKVQKVNASKAIPLSFEKKPPQNVSRDSEPSPSGACFAPADANPCGK